MLIVSRGAFGAAAKRPRLIVFVLADTLRADHVGVYGYNRPTTPELDALFRQGSIMYTQSYAAAGYTQPSKTSMMTGQRPSRHGYTSYKQGKEGAIGFNVVSYLKSKGYFTIVSNANPNTYWIDKRFDKRWGAHWKKGEVHRYYPADKVIEEAKKALDEAKDKDVFLFLQFADPHLPYDPPEYDPAFFTDDPIGSRFDPKFDGIRADRVDELTPSVLANMRNRYDASIRYMDNQLAPFLRSLQQTYPDHFIVFTSDHGEAFLEHGEAGHAKAMYNTVIRVPLVVIDSARPRNGLETSGALVSGLDLFQTLIERFGESSDRYKLDGRSFTWTWTAAPARPHGRVVVSESPYYNDEMSGSGRCWGLAYYYQPHWGDATGTVAKLTTYGPDCEKLRYSTIHRNQWFDADDDLAQMQQLRPREVQVASIEPRFAAWSKPKIDAPTPRPALTAEQIETLRSLGYFH